MLCQRHLQAPPALPFTRVENGEYVKFGGRIQVQYHYEDPDEGDSEDDFFFRRLRPYVEGSLHPDWKGKFQIDYGKAEDDNEVAVKDAYLQYKSYENIRVTPRQRLASRPLPGTTTMTTTPMN